MLKLTRKLEYALIALRHIQGQATKKIVKSAMAHANLI